MTARERAGTPGARWESELRSTGERLVADGQPEPRANRAARRAAARTQGRREAQQGREGAQTAASRPNSPNADRFPRRPQSGAQSLDSEPPTRTEPQP